MSGDVVFIVRVDDQEVRAGLKRAARMVQKDVNAELTRYANGFIVPTAKHLAPRIIRDTLIARGTSTGAVMTTTARGKRRAIVGATNFGGMARSPILPKRRKALRMPDGRLVAKVTTPRRIPGIHYMERALAKHRREIVRTLDGALTRTLQRRIVGIER